MKKAIIPLGIIVLMIFGVFMYVNRFTEFHTVEVEGRVFNSDDITSNLTAGVTKESNKITFENVKVNDTIYKSGKKYYIGEENKKNIVIDYPIITEDSSSLLILSDNGNFVDEKYNKSTTYKNTYISEGTLYNGVNYTKADDAKYIFVEAGMGIYVNLAEVKLTTEHGDYTIPKFSFVYFESSFLRFYYDVNGSYKFKEIAAIKDYDKIVVNEKKHDYYDFLILLGVLEPKTDKYEPEPEIPEEEPEKEDNTTGSTVGTDSIQLPAPNQKPNGEANLVDKEYVKPEVKASNIKAGVYSLKAHLDVYDPADRIYKAPTFEFYIGEELYMRISFSRTADVTIGGLLPNCTYQVYGVYNYKDELDRKRGGKFEVGEITTKSTSELEDLDMAFGKIETTTKKVKINDIRFKNKTGSEVLYGLKTGYLNLNDGTNIKLSLTNITDLSNLKKTVLESGSILNSGTEYTGEFTFYDIAGTKMNIKNNKVKFKTLKSPPTAELEIKKMNRNFTTIYTETLLKNPDKVVANNYRIVLYETETQKQVAIRNLKTPEEEIDYQESAFEEILRPETYYTAVVYCDYINDDGKWIYNYEIISEKIYTADLSSLGAVPVSILVSEIDSISALIDIKFTSFDLSEAVYLLMEDSVPVVIETLDDETGEVESEFVINDFNKNQIGAGITINTEIYTELDSNTSYRVKVLPYILLDEQNYSISTTPTEVPFRTLRLTPTIYLTNGYVATGYADYDICIEDIDGAIINGEAQVEFVDENGGGAGTIIVPTKTSCTTNRDEENPEDYNEFEAFSRITTKNLEKNKNYTLEVRYPNYQLDATETDSSKHTEKPLGEDVRLKADGTDGNFEMIGLTNDVNYDLQNIGGTNSRDLSDINLFDVTNNSRWIYKGHIANEMTLETRMDSKEFEITSADGYKAFSYYIPELKGKDYTISFEYDFKTATKNAEKGAAYIVFSDNALNMAEITNLSTNINNPYLNNTMLIQNANAENQKTGYSVYSSSAGNNLSQTGNYITFYLKVPKSVSEETSLTVKRLKIDIGYRDLTTTELPTYTEFGTNVPNAEHTNTYAGEFFVEFANLMSSSLQSDKHYPTIFYNENWEYKYYIKFYANGEEIVDETTQDLIEEGAASFSENVVKRFLTANSKIEARIGVNVKYTENYSKDNDLMSMEFTTETETRKLKSISELSTMHPYGYYLIDLENQECPNLPTVSNCIDLTNLRYTQTFQGSLDFQGQSVYIKGYNSPSGNSYYHVNNYLFEKIGGAGIIKNLNIYYDFEENNTVQNERWNLVSLAKYNNGLISNVRMNYIADIQPRRMVIGTSDPYACTKTDPETGEEYETTCTKPEPKYFKDSGLIEFTFLANTNNGTIENFHVNLEKKLPILKTFGSITISNNGTIKNGYVTGNNINAGFYNSNTQKEIGVIAAKSNANSKISNVYSLVDITVIQNEYSDSVTFDYIDTDSKSYTLTYDPSAGIGQSENITNKTNERIAGNIVFTATNAVIENVLTLDPRYIKSGSEYNYEENGRVTTFDPIIPFATNCNTKNLYYIHKEDFDEKVSEKVLVGALTAPKFMQNAINSDNLFNVEQASGINSFPKLLWPDIMPSQTMQKFPEEKLSIIEVLSVKEVLQEDKLSSDEKSKGYKAKVTLEMYNPDDLIVSELEFDGLTDIVLPGNKQSNSNYDGIHELTIYIKNISKFQVDYKLSKISIVDGDVEKTCTNDGIDNDNLDKFDCSSISTKEYPIDIYLYVSNLNELKDAIEDGNNNLRLANNISTIDTSYFLENTATHSFTGVLDGNGFSIQSLESDDCFIKELVGGTIKNLSIKKYKVNYTGATSYDAYGGLVCKASTGATIDNVHIGEVFDSVLDENQQMRERSYTVLAKGPQTYIGGLVAYSTGATIINSSVSDMVLPDPIPNTIDSGELYIGGIVGYMENTSITNTFVRNIDLKLTNKSGTQNGYSTLNSAGGIAGYVKSGTLENVYATGTIDAKVEATGNVGGIAGTLAAEYNWEGEIVGNIVLKSAISRVNVYTNGDNIAGIIGKTDIASNFASQTLALADVMTTKASSTNLDRTSGTKITSNKNFAWNKQLINSKVDANTNMEELLSEEDLYTTSVYQTKIGLNPTDFALGLDSTSLKDDSFYMVVKYDTQFEKDLKRVLKQEEIIRFTNEDGRDVEGFVTTIDGVEQTIEIKNKYGTIPRIRHTMTGEVLANQEYTSTFKDVNLEYIEKFNIITEPVYTYQNINETEQKVEEVKPWEADYVALSFQLQISDPDINVETLFFNITDMHYYGAEEDEKNEFGHAVSPRPELELLDDTKGIYMVTSKVVANTNKNYDSYNIEQFDYYTFSNPREEQHYPTKIKMVIPFYGKIDSVDDWQAIQKGTLQNFSLAADLDFSDIADPNAEISFNKLIGLQEGGRNYQIKNITITDTHNKKSLIKNVASELRSVDFINIKLTVSETWTGVGILETINGDLYGYTVSDTQSYDVGFYDIQIHAKNSSKVGIIGTNNSTNMTNITLENVYVRGKQYVGGLIGYSPKHVKKNINGRNIIVVSSSSYTGGLIGKDELDNTRAWTTNVNLNGVYIKGGASYSAGAMGHGSGDNIVVTGSTASIDLASLPSDHGVEANAKYNIIKGTQYVAGVIGYSSGCNLVQYLTAESLDIDSTNNNVGGVIGTAGYAKYLHSINNDVKGVNSVGGAVGSGSNKYHFYVAGNKIEGTDNVGGLVGTCGYQYMIHSQVGPSRNSTGEIYRETTIDGNQNVGGLVGKATSNALIQHNIVQAQITAKNTVGGGIGLIDLVQTVATPDPMNIKNNIIANATVIAKTPRTESVITYGPNTLDTTISTIDRITSASAPETQYYFLGGLIGRFYRNFRSDNKVEGNFVSVTLITENKPNEFQHNLNGVGYIYGGTTYAYKNSSPIKEQVVDEETGKVTTITKPNYILYDWTSKNGDEYVYKKLNDKLESCTRNTKLYENSTINGVTYKTLTTLTSGSAYNDYVKYYTDPITTGNLKILDINKLKTYDSNAYVTGGFAKSGRDIDPSNPSSKSIEYYPYPSTDKYLEIVEIAIDDHLPNGTANPGTASARFDESINQSSGFHMLPEFEVYVSDVDKINIEFKELDSNTMFTINNVSYFVNQNIYTFYYDFNEDFDIKISDGKNEKIITITADEIRNGVSVIGDYYYKLDDEEVISNQSVVQKNDDEISEDASIASSEEIINEKSLSPSLPSNGMFRSVGKLTNKKSSKKLAPLDKKDEKRVVINNASNIYENEILLENQNIYNITTGEIKENSFENLSLVETKPLFEGEYNGQKIQTYLNYSLIDGIRIDKQIFIHNGQIEVIEQAVQNNKSNIFIQSYEDKSFVIYLSKDGTIHSLKDGVVFPKKFKNLKIKSINNNFSTNTDNLIVEYEDGSYIAFNYRTGEVISERKNKNIELIDYIKDYIAISSTKGLDTISNKSYEEAKKLVNKLNKKSVDQVLRGEKIENSNPELYSRKYSIVYNPTINKYEVYEIPTKSQTVQNSLAVTFEQSVDEIIDSNPKLIKYYRGEKNNVVSTTSSILITFGVVIGIIASTIMIGRYYKRVRKARG